MSVHVHWVRKELRGMAEDAGGAGKSDYGSQECVKISALVRELRLRCFAVVTSDDPNGCNYEYEESSV